MENTLEQASTSTLIDLQSLTKVFYTEEVETHALSDIHLDIKAGEFVSIAGPSGCGKTTLLSILGLLDSPTSGDYLLDGEPVASLTAGEDPQPGDRIHLPSVQPDRRPHGLRECGASAHVPRDAR